MGIILVGHTGPIWRAMWSPDDSRIATVGWDDATVRVWDADTGAQLVVFTDHKPPVQDVAWSPDGRAVVTISRYDTAKIWDAATGHLIRDLYPEGFGLGVLAAGWSPDGTRIATYGRDGLGRIWDASTGTELVTFTGHMGDVWGGIMWSRTGERILTSGGDGTVRVWDVTTGKELIRYEFGSGLAAAWSPDGTRIGTASTAEEREQFGLPPR